MYLAKYGYSCFYPQKQFDNSNVLINENELVTCGKIPDPRIQFEVDVATTVTLMFKSDAQNEFGGVNLYILEIKPSPTDPVRITQSTKQAALIRNTNNTQPLMHMKAYKYYRLYME